MTYNHQSILTISVLAILATSSLGAMDSFNVNGPGVLKLEFEALSVTIENSEILENRQLLAFIRKENADGIITIKSIIKDPSNYTAHCSNINTTDETRDMLQSFIVLRMKFIKKENARKSLAQSFINRLFEKGSLSTTSIFNKKLSNTKKRDNLTRHNTPSVISRLMSLVKNNKLLSIGLASFGVFSIYKWFNRSEKTGNQQHQ